MRIFLAILSLIGAQWAAPALAQQTAPQSRPAAEAAAPRTPLPAPPQPKSLDELLEMVSEGFEAERTANLRREEEFKRNREDQERLLKEALAKLAGDEATSQRLEVRYNENELALGTAEQRMTERLGELGELFGVVRQVATDLGAQTWDSLTSSEGGSHRELLDRLGRGDELPSTDDLEKLWLELQREITKQGKVVRYRTTVLTIEGTQAEREVIRAGPFSAISNGHYLLWEPEDQQLRELNRQPPSRHLDTVGSFENATTAYAKLAVDPSRGGLLEMLIDTPSRKERIQQGGYVGYVIITLGIVALLVGLWRWVVIAVTSRKVAAQRKSERIDPSNTLWVASSASPSRIGTPTPRHSNSSSTRWCCASRRSSRTFCGW
jgi:biopolymer transport protein ExbB